MNEGDTVKVEGDEAKNHKAVRLDSMDDVNRGELVFADEETGVVKWRDSVGEIKEVTLGARAIKIRDKHPYGR